MRSIPRGRSLLSPFSKSVNIFSLFKKKERPKRIIYGYLPYWTIEKKEFLQYDKLTDIAYFGLHIDKDGNFLKVDVEGNQIPGYLNWKDSPDLDEIIKKSKEEGVRFALTIISHVDEVSDEFLNCRECWDTLLENIKQELRFKDITDLNMNFEYYEYTENSQHKLYQELIKYYNEELDKEFGDSFVVVATFADSLVKPRVTSDIDNLSKSADGIFIMGYDFHRPTSDNAGPVAPLGGIGIHSDYDLKTMVKDYLSVSPPNKLIMGVPYYGYNWVVETDEEYAKRIEGNDNSGYSMSQAYEEVMEVILENDPEIMWDELGQTPFFTYTSEETDQIREVYYENSQSLEAKYSLINENNLAGVGIWALGYDGGYIELWDLLYEKFVK